MPHIYLTSFFLSLSSFSSILLNWLFNTTSLSSICLSAKNLIHKRSFDLHTYLPTASSSSVKKRDFFDPSIHRDFQLKMSLDIASERVCYVQCNFCNTVLAVSVPCSSMFTIVTVRCGHCANLLSVNVGALLPTFPTQDAQKSQKQQMNTDDGSKESGSSSECNKFPPFLSGELDHPRISPIRPPEKRQRVPSAYNRFIKEEIQRIKARNPEISHREAFSTAAKNWAHFPHIHFGLKLDGNKQANKSDHPVAADQGTKVIDIVQPYNGQNKRRMLS